MPGTVRVSGGSNSDVSPWVTLKGARLEAQPWDGQGEGDGLLGVHEWAGQDCGELETSPAVTLLGQGLTALEVQIGKSVV